ncbi:PQQ-dependent sugar dehydrogenase, partial [Paenibacillus piri]
DAFGAAKEPSAALASGDKLTVTAANGQASRTYAIAVSTVPAEPSANVQIQLKASGHANLIALDETAHTVTALDGTTVEQLTAQIESTDGSQQTYAVTDAGGAAKEPSAALASGDKLTVTAANGRAQSVYSIIAAVSKRYEGEAGTPFTTSGVTAGTANDANASGGKYLQLNGTPAVGDWLEFKLNVSQAGTYHVVFGYKSNNNRSITQLYVDDVPFGNPIDQYAAASAMTSVKLGNITFAQAGEHKFKFVITGKNAASSAYATTFDFIELTDISGGGNPGSESSNTNIQLKGPHPYVTSVNTANASIAVLGGATAADLAGLVEAADGSAQTYAVLSTNGSRSSKEAVVKKPGSPLATGDKLVVTAADKMATASYAINVTIPKKTDIPYDVRIIAENLHIPWAFDMAKNGTLYFTERNGKVRLMRGDQLRSEPVIDLSANLFLKGESGLLGMVLDPNFETNRYMYVYQSYIKSGTATANRVLRLVVSQDGNTAAIDKTLLDDLPATPTNGNGNHSGGRIKIGPDGYMYITVGENYVQEKAQNLNDPGGKILRMKLDGSVPADNPFVGNPAANPYVYSYGHRNPQGLAWNDSGVLYSAEHGDVGHDEINIIDPGGNYGWPVIEGDLESVVNGVTLRAPILHTGNDRLAPSGIAFVKKGPWTGKLFVTNLRGSQLVLLSFEDGRMKQEAYFNSEYGRIRDVFEDAAGNIYISSSNHTDPNKDRVVKLTPMNRSANTNIKLKDQHPNLHAVDIGTLTLKAMIGSTVANLSAQIESTSADAQGYAVTDTSGQAKTEGPLATGDKLVVTAADGMTKASYTITVSNIYIGRTTPYTVNPTRTVTTPNQAGAIDGVHLQVATTTVGDTVEFTLNVPAAGNYGVIYSYKKHPGRGIFQLSINGTPQGAPLDLYVPDAQAGMYKSNMGEVAIAEAGGHKFRFVYTGRNAAATSGALSVDYIELVQLSASGNPEPQSNNTTVRLKASGHANLTAVDMVNKTITAVSGTTVAQLVAQVEAADGSAQTYAVTTAGDQAKVAGALVSSDKLVVTAADGSTKEAYTITVETDNANATSAGELSLVDEVMTAGTTRNIQVAYNVTSKVPLTTSSTNHPVFPKWEVIFTLPNGIAATTADEVSIVGMDKRKLTSGEISANGKIVTLKELELQPHNGTDVLLFLNAKAVPAVSSQGYEFKATNAIQGKDHSVGAASEKAVLSSVDTVSDLKRVIKIEKYSEPDYTRTQLSWLTPANATNVKVEQSTDGGLTWSDASFTVQQKTVTTDDVNKIKALNGELVDRKPASELTDLDKIAVGLHEIPKYAVGVSVTTADVTNLTLNKNYEFRLKVTGGNNAGISNTAKYYTGHFNIADFGAVSAASTAGAIDNTRAIQAAFDTAAATGGGTVYVPAGIFGQGTIHLKSNVYLYLAEGSVLWALKGAIDDRGVRLNQYQDNGHSFHHSAMFYGLRLDNVKIVGTGLIHGGTAMITGDPASSSGQSDKQVSLTLSTNYEFGGYGAAGGPYALKDKSNKLKVQRVGHFQLLSGGVDYMDIHDVYVVDEDTAKKFDNNNNLIGYIGGTYTNRDIFDLMSDSFVSIVNVYTEFAADDIVKLGSDYALGFTRHTGNYRVDQIEGWTWCNLFQIGSETVGNISNIHVSNINVHQADKSGFSISINDGTTVNNLLLDGTNKMTGTKAPITMAISNRGRRPGGPEAGLVGGIKNVTLKNIQITEAVGVKSGETWAPTVSGYFNKDTGITHYAENITLENISITAKKANPTRSSAQVALGQNLTDPVKDAVPVEMPTRYPSPAGNYNVGDLGQRPSYGFYLRHIKNAELRNVTTTFDAGEDDGRYAVAVEDVIGARFDRLTVPKFSAKNDYLVKISKSSGVTFVNSAPIGDLNGIDVADQQLLPAQGGSTAIELKPVHPNLIALDPVARILTVGAGTSVEQLMAQIQSANASSPTFAVVTAGGLPKVTGPVAAGDKLVVTSQDSSNSTDYSIVLEALSANTDIRMRSAHPNIRAIDTAARSILADTGTTVEQLLAQIESADGSHQTYTVADSAGGERGGGALAAGDKLNVRAADGAAQASYAIVMSVSRIYEGESTPFTTSGINTTTANDAAASGGSYRQFGSTSAVNDWIEYTVNVPAPGTYNVLFTYKTNNNRGIVQLFIDGTTQGNPVDEYFASQTYRTADLGNVTFTTGGDRKFRFVVTGKNASSSGTGITFDYIKLVEIPGGGPAPGPMNVRLQTIPQQQPFVQVKQNAHPHIIAVYNQERSIIAYTGTTAADLTAEIESPAAMNQSYTVTDAVYGQISGSKPLQTGNRLNVTSQDGTASTSYSITVTDIVYEAAVTGKYTMSGNFSTTAGTDHATNYAYNGATNGSQLQVTFTAAGDWIEFTVNVPAAGNYQIALGYCKSNNRANPQLSVGGTDVGLPVVQYVSDAALQGMYLSAIGQAHLEAGSQTFRFKHAGRSGGSGNVISFDIITLTKLN